MRKGTCQTLLQITDIKLSSESPGKTGKKESKYVPQSPQSELYETLDLFKLVGDWITRKVFVESQGHSV